MIKLKLFKQNLVFSSLQNNLKHTGAQRIIFYTFLYNIMFHKR